MRNVFIAAAVAVLAGCSTNKPTPQAPAQSEYMTPLGTQRLASNFQRQGIRFEWDCTWGTGWSERTCSRTNIKAIEVTAYATSNGNTENVREVAFRIAEAKAKAKLRHFIHEDISSSVVITTLTKNIEKAGDLVQSGANPRTVEITDEEAAKTTGTSNRENSNNIQRNVVEVVRENAQGILRGVYVVDQKIVDRQTVQVTIRWDGSSMAFSNGLRKQFGN